MRAYLQGGPANGRVIDSMPEGQTIWREAIPRELTITDCLQQYHDISKAEPNYDVADYRFSGMATVDVRGRVGCVIYQFDGMEP